MNDRLKNGGGLSADIQPQQQRPLISQGSRQIMEQKRNLASASGSAFFEQPVHERLHGAAIAKQQMIRSKNRSHSQRGPNSNGSFDQEREERITFSNRATKRGFKSAARKPPVPMMQGSAQSHNSMRNESPRNGGNGANYGERLYRRGLKKREELEQRLRNARSEQMRAEVEPYTFHPSINNKNSQNQERQLPTEELLLNYGKRRDEVINF